MIRHAKSVALTVFPPLIHQCYKKRCRIVIFLQGSCRTRQSYRLCFLLSQLPCSWVLSFIHTPQYVDPVFLHISLPVMNFHEHIFSIDTSKLTWTLKVRVTRMWLTLDNQGNVVRHNMILLDCLVSVFFPFFAWSKCYFTFENCPKFAGHAHSRNCKARNMESSQS